MVASAAAAVPAPSLPRLATPRSPSAVLPSPGLRAHPVAAPLYLSAKRRACACAATGSGFSSSNSGNQTSLMPPFSFTFDEGSSSSKRPYRWKRVLLKVKHEEELNG